MTTTTTNFIDALYSRLIKDITEGNTLVWQCPWVGYKATNLETKKEYSGNNLFILESEMYYKGYTQNFWATFNQVKQLGGYVLKGEKGISLSRYGTTEKVDKKTGEIKKSTYCKGFTVFNVQQTSLYVQPEKTNLMTYIENQLDVELLEYLNCNKILLKSANGAWFSPGKHEICIPHISNWSNHLSYKKTLSHEIAHSTGFILHREMNSDMSSYAYAKEEIIAEMTAITLLTGFTEDTTSQEYLETYYNSVAYLQSWGQKIINFSTVSSREVLRECFLEALTARDIILGK